MADDQTKEQTQEFMRKYLMRNINTLNKKQKIKVAKLLKKHYVLTEVSEGLAINLNNVRPDILTSIYNLVVYYKSIVS